jgi:cyclopropane fatty-acyl-phospholipid synthase-like methyltransferase
MPDHPDLEAAIHCARYALAKGLVSGKRVLDVACGEGYGSFLLKHAGAASVVGVDVDAPTIERCKKNFQLPGLEFRVANAEKLAEIFKAGEFDVVVSIETIEHVQSPEDLLRGIKHVLKPTGSVVITCPNDSWYYKDSDKTNPYHRTRFSSAKFRELSTGILGSDVQWSLGTAGLGFVSSPVEQESGYARVPSSWFARVDDTRSYVVTTLDGPQVDEDTCSYFVGVWGVQQPVSGSALFPVSMDTYAAMISAVEQVWTEDGRERRGIRREAPDNATLQQLAEAQELQNLRSTVADLEREQAELATQLSQTLSERDALATQAHGLTQEKTELTHQLRAKERENKILGLRFSAAASENALLRERLNTLSSQVQAAHHELHRERSEKVNLRIGHDRYVKIRALVPGFVRTPVVYSYRGIRKVLKG